MPELIQVDAKSVTASGPQNWVKGQLSAKWQLPNKFISSRNHRTALGKPAKALVLHL